MQHLHASLYSVDIHQMCRALEKHQWIRREDGKFEQKMAGDRLEKGRKGVVWEERCECGAPEAEEARAHCWEEMLHLLALSGYDALSRDPPGCKVGGTDALTLGCSSAGVCPQQWAERVWC